MGKMCFQPSFPILLSECPSVHTSFLPALPLIPNDSLCLLSFFHMCFISPPSSPSFLSCILNLFLLCALISFIMYSLPCVLPFFSLSFIQCIQPLFILCVAPFFPPSLSFLVS
ncbi:hypothetical protein AMECASPLE_004874 [Ameca splendens]|uniref:Uncharacterized protein n=1 Tax=Ameca splendens TaxID=208324 RepID=A0ABV0XYW9_9TELE